MLLNDISRRIAPSQVDFRKRGIPLRSRQLHDSARCEVEGGAGAQGDWRCGSYDRDVALRRQIEHGLADARLEPGEGLASEFESSFNPRSHHHHIAMPPRPVCRRFRIRHVPLQFGVLKTELLVLLGEKGTDARIDLVQIEFAPARVNYRDRGVRRRLQRRSPEPLRSGGSVYPSRGRRNECRRPGTSFREPEPVPGPTRRDRHRPGESPPVRAESR